MRCGGGRDYRIGRTEKSVEKLLVLLDSSIAEIFVNDGELVFTTRIYLETSERRLQVTGSGLCRLEMICGEDCSSSLPTFHAQPAALNRVLSSPYTETPTFVSSFTFLLFLTRILISPSLLSAVIRLFLSKPSSSILSATMFCSEDWIARRSGLAP